MGTKKYTNEEIQEAFKKLGLLDSNEKEFFHRLRQLSSPKKRKHITFEDIRTYSQEEMKEKDAKLE